jgi:hypothetical protein
MRRTAASPERTYAVGRLGSIRHLPFSCVARAAPAKAVFFGSVPKPVGEDYAATDFLPGE